MCYIINMSYLLKDVCAICARHRDVVRDHDHKTKQTRGKLCLACNSGLGQFQDSITMLQKAMAYLQYHKDNPSNQHYNRVANTKIPVTQPTSFLTIFRQLPIDEQERLLKGSH